MTSPKNHADKHWLNSWRNPSSGWRSCAGYNHLAGFKY